MTARVIAVHRAAEHRFSKATVDEVRLLEGHGVEGDAWIEITGLRNPCHQIESFRPGLLRRVLGTAADGSVVRKAGVMGVVLRSGVVRAGDAVTILRVPGVPVALTPV